ncbi:hypothetical protein TWF694_006635 [Orbilia ellipsospora]|uniref:Uncharacterized protein n=1 Tax=Orbilia ellipsospora TaxID=2528407 RepID=A0AAV9XMC6_9PEZI
MKSTIILSLVAIASAIAIGPDQKCGGFAGFACEGNKICVRDPQGPWPCADCFGICVDPHIPGMPMRPGHPVATRSTPPQKLCGGPQGLRCEMNEYCQADVTKHCPECYGTCRPRVQCDILLQDGCQEGQFCAADPIIGPRCPLCPGHCVDKPLRKRNMNFGGKQCGGFMGLACGEGEICVNNNRGCADCFGKCIKA